MLLTGSRWFWISSPWLSMQACSHTPAGRCDGRALHEQQTGALSMTQTLTPSLPVVQVSDQLCAWRVGQTWTVRLGGSCPGLPASWVPQFSQVQYGRNKFVGSLRCNQLYYQIKSAVILCITRDDSLFFVNVCSPSLQKYPPGCHRVCDHGNRGVHAHQRLLLHSPGNTRCSGLSCRGCGELSLLLLSPQCGQLMLRSWQVFQRWLSSKMLYCFGIPLDYNSKFFLSCLNDNEK